MIDVLYVIEFMKNLEQIVIDAYLHLILFTMYESVIATDLLQR